MSFSLFATVAVIAYALICMAYVYKWRGTTRYTFSQYMRKSWPIFAPLNCVLYMTTRASARKPVLSADSVPNLSILRDNWEVIRDEALRLRSDGAFEAAKAAGSAGYYDVGFRTFFKRGWSKFYLKWYGTTHRSAQLACPKTVALLNQVPEIHGAMFSILPAGSELSLHSDPMACSLRYQLGLQTPNSDRCVITVDGIDCAWYDGKDFIFDETYPHHALNGTESSRLILMCDVARPLNVVGRVFNYFYRFLARGTVVPNTEDDKKGALSAIFSSISPIQRKLKNLKTENRNIYRVFKLFTNTTIILIALSIIYFVFYLLEIILENGL